MWGTISQSGEACPQRLKWFFALNGRCFGSPARGSLERNLAGMTVIIHFRSKLHTIRAAGRRDDRYGLDL
jgi:hypothetical protein